MRQFTISKAKVHDLIIHGAYLSLIIIAVLTLEISLHHLNEEMFLTWVCADVRGALIFIIPANDEKIAKINNIKNPAKKHAVVIIKEFVTTVLIGILSFEITEYFLGHHQNVWYWWATDILVIVALWLVHYVTIEYFVNKYKTPAETAE